MRVPVVVTSAVLSLLAGLLSACGPAAARYEVELKLARHCETRGAEHLCDDGQGARMATDLFVEPDAQGALIELMGQNYLSTSQGPLYAERRSRDEGRDGCARERLQQLWLEQGFWEIHGDYVEQLTSSGPADSCADRVTARRWQWQLQGPQKEGP